MGNNRRDFIKKGAFLLGGAIAAPVLPKSTSVGAEPPKVPIAILDLSAMPKTMSPETLMKIFMQTGVLYYNA